MSGLNEDNFDHIELVESTSRKGSSVLDISKKVR